MRDRIVRRLLAALLLLTGALAAPLPIAEPAMAQFPPGTWRSGPGLQVLEQPGSRQVTRPGTPTQGEVAVTAPGAIGETRASQLLRLPFGAQIFQGAVPPAADGPNPNYVVTTGDRVAVRLWGATEADVTGSVDLDGNVFVPGIGPVRMAGLRAGDLQRSVADRVQQVYPANVNVYATLLAAQRVGVFVTGFVVRPGRHLGSSSDTVLDYLVRAGGVDPSRGSYRDITVQRRGRVLARVDLYRFLLAGELPSLDLAEGDTIVVARQRGLVAVEGAARNDFLFELPASGAFQGRELVDLARPLPAATHAAVVGSRGGAPWTRYVRLQAFGAERLTDQDRVTFLADAPASSATVTVEGSRIGPSLLVVGRDARLPEVLDRIAVEPALAATQNVSILRRSVAEQQRRSINEALDRLERGIFLGTAITEGEAAIRASEAQLIASFVARARQVVPEGRLVVADAQGRIAPVRLEDGDIILIPEISQTVLVSGEVLVPQAVLWEEGRTAGDYIARAGGYSQRADTGGVLVRRQNGELVLGTATRLNAGDELIVLPRIETKYFQIAKDITQILFQIAGAVRLFTLD